MPVYTDQLGRSVQLSAPPKRIISLVPSQTELLFDLGLEEETVGITKFCVHPEHWFRSKTRVGGTKAIKPEVVRQLQPDLIIANKEENVQEQVEVLAAAYPVWVSDIHNLAQALDMIRCVGELTGKLEKAGTIIQQIENGFNALTGDREIYNEHIQSLIAQDPQKDGIVSTGKESAIQKENISSIDEESGSKKDSADLLNDQIAPVNNETRAKPVNTAYLIWKDPYMTAGNDTFIHDMLTRCGCCNVFGHATRYPVISLEDLQNAHCELLLLSSEPYPFRQKHVEELQPLLPYTTILLVDGEMFSWYGSRLRHAPAYFQTLLASIKTS